jgi:hypothetical protein
MALFPSQTKRRTREQIEACESELLDRGWYYRSFTTPKESTPPDIFAAMLNHRSDLRRQYPDLDLDGNISDYEYGVLAGKHAGLRWALGMEWDEAELFDT